MKKEIKIGLFAIIVVAAALFMIEFLKGKDLFSKNNTYYIIYPSVEGLGVSSAVTIGGYNAGTVSDISYNASTGDFTIAASISKEFGVPEDSYMEIYSSDILGTKKIRVNAGTSAVMARPGDTLAGSVEKDMITSLGGSLDTVIRQIGTVAESVNLLLDENNRKEINIMLRRLNNTAADLNSVTKMLRGKEPAIADMIDNINSLAAKLDSAATYISGTASNAEAITATLRDAGIGETIDSLRLLVSKIQNPEGSIGKLMANDSLYNSLTSLSNNLDSLVMGIRNDPKKYIKISVF